MSTYDGRFHPHGDRYLRPFQREIAAELGVSRRVVRYQVERLRKPPKIRGMYRCRKCRELGHNSRTCKNG